MSIGDAERPASNDPTEEPITALEAERRRAGEAAPEVDIAEIQDEEPAEDVFERATGAVFGKS
jgi:hypothetical protein